MRINWNEGQTNSFVSSRGLKQIDMILPYLFVLALEILGHIIFYLISSNVWKPISLGLGSAPKISYVCFIDNVVLIVEASMEQTHLVRETLLEFCMKSGQKINLSKSKVFFFKNIGIER